MAVNVHPSDSVADNGTAAKAISLFNSLAAGASYVHSGFNVTDGGGLVASVALGTAIIAGVLIDSDAAQTTTCANNTTNKVYLDTDGTVGDTTGSIPAGSLFLATVVTSGGSITSITVRHDVENNLNVFKLKSSDETVNSSTTMQDDNDLQFPILAGQMWEFKIVLDTSSGATPDFKFQTNQTAGHIIHFSSGRDADITNRSCYAASIGTAMTVLHHSSADGHVYAHGYFVAEADGDFKLQWAQNTSDAGNTTVKANSFLVARRLLG